MPTVICLDVSLSMLRPISGQLSTDISEDEIPTRKKIAVEAINQFLDHISTNCKLEFLALLTFSSEYRVLTELFTRNIEQIRSCLTNIEECDKTNYGSVLEGIATTVMKQWSNTLPVEILLITDGAPGFGPGCLQDVIEKAEPFPFPCKMNILALSDPDEKNFTENIQMLQKLIQVTTGDGLVYLPENHLNAKGCSSAVSKLCTKDFNPYRGILRCGQLTSRITLCPSPQAYYSRSEEKRYEISNTIDVIGFMEINDLGSPAALSRHLLLPIKSSDSTTIPDSIVIDDEAEGNAPNFCVLLHGALKVENFCALCELSPEWYGFIYSWADNKKKSNMMISILHPGVDVVPWLGKISQLGPKSEYLLQASGNASPSSSSASVPTFPVKPIEKKSYISNPTVWLKPEEGLYSDVQKLLRLARKMPDKTAQFFKELNRMRRWALTLGFVDSLESIATILEKECLVSSTLPSEATFQITHAVQQLRTLPGYNKQISPHTRIIR